MSSAGGDEPFRRGRGGRDPSLEGTSGRRRLQQPDELLDRERLGLQVRPSRRRWPRDDPPPCTRSGRRPRASRRAAGGRGALGCRRRAPRAARIDSSIAPEPSQPAVPADVTTGAASPSRSTSAARRNPSAIGERQMFPVQTTRIPLMTKGASLATRARPAGARRALRERASPRRRIDRGPVREVERRWTRHRPAVAPGRGRRRRPSPNSAWSSSQVSAGGRPERFALVTASGPVSARRASASGWCGARTPTVGGSPPRSHPEASAPRGQDERERSRPAAPPRAARPARRTRLRLARPPTVATSTGSSRSRGRRFASNTRAVAAGSSGRVPIP